ncbi:MAG: hypothetical protein ACFCBW_10045 [Candidatus Competibacterales bacterium]
MAVSSSRSSPGVILLIIDPQNDFSDDEGAALRIPGANDDAQRLGALIDRLAGRIEGIFVTLDTHQRLDIAHPLFWLDSAGHPPAPLTVITEQDLASGRWRPFDPDLYPRALAYVQALEAHRRYQLRIWPPHCLVGSWGHGLMPAIEGALGRWEVAQRARVQFLPKGHNPFTEHYSAIQADVPDANDPTTQPNQALLKPLTQARQVLLSGQAASHCVANTGRDLATQLGADFMAKVVLLQDTTSSVPGFEAVTAEFVADMQQMGMKLARAADFDPDDL